MHVLAVAFVRERVEEYKAILDPVVGYLNRGYSVYVHCVQGQYRSPVLPAVDACMA